MIALLATYDPVKLSAIRVILARAGVDFQVFDAATGDLLPSAIPVRVMVAEEDQPAARTALWSAGFRPAADRDWDLVGERDAHPPYGFAGPPPTGGRER